MTISSGIIPRHFIKNLGHISAKQIPHAIGILCLSVTSAFAQNFMSEKELLATIPGHMLYGLSETDGKTQWAQNYGKARGKKGKIKGVFGGDQYDAEYFVKDGQWCENWGSGSGCWHVERVGEKEFRMYKDGKARKHNWYMK